MHVKIRVRASLVCRECDRILMVQLQDPMTKVANWFPPGGKVEDDESPEEAAIRETFEETGYRVRVIPNKNFVAEYPFTWNGELYHCITHCFLGELAEEFHEPRAVQDASYNLGARWFSTNEISGLLSFNDDIRNAVLKLLKL